MKLNYERVLKTIKGQICKGPHCRPKPDQNRSHYVHLHPVLSGARKLYSHIH